MQVHIVTKTLDSPWPEDICPEIVKVFKGSRIKAANAWAECQEKDCNSEYLFSVETWKVE